MGLTVDVIGEQYNEGSIELDVRIQADVYFDTAKKISDLSKGDQKNLTEVYSQINTLAPDTVTKIQIVDYLTTVRELNFWYDGEELCIRLKPRYWYYANAIMESILSRAPIYVKAKVDGKPNMMVWVHVRPVCIFFGTPRNPSENAPEAMLELLDDQLSE